MLIINSWEEAKDAWIFPKLNGGLSFYRSQLPEDAGVPIMIFEDLTVDSSFRQQGLGSAGMLAVIRHFRAQGVRGAFLRIGTPPGEAWPTGKIWRQKMYEKLGWIVLENHPDYGGDVPIMWHSMTGEPLCLRVDEVEIEMIA